MESNSNKVYKEVDYMLVGQGLAGTVLARVLLKQGKRIHVIDDADFSNSSKVSGGMYNPIVFKRLTKSWMADALVPFAEAFYQALETDLGQVFLKKKQLIKLFTEAPEHAFWKKKSGEAGFEHFLSLDAPDFTGMFKGEAGAGVVRLAGNVDIVGLLKAFRHYLLELDLLDQARFQFELLGLHGSSVTYKQVRAKKIIFCEGYKAASNPFFQGLPFKLTKGETLIIRIPSLQYGLNGQGDVITKGVFILPLGNCLYKVGATYNWADLDETPTDTGKQQLLEKLNKVLLVPYEVVSQEAGVRPTVSDRRPLIGLHPAQPLLGFFNGMGTKGTLLAPYFAQHFSNFLDGTEALNKEVDINRYYSNGQFQATYAH